jgi:hypothetical protein
LPIGHFDLVFCLVRSPDIAYQNKTAVHNRLFKVAAEATLTIAVDSKHAIEAAARHPACTMLPKSSLPSSNRTPIHGLQSAVDMMDNTKDWRRRLPAKIFHQPISHVLFEHFSLSEAFIMVSQIRRLTSQHRIFVLQCAQTISQVNCARKVFVRGVSAPVSAEPHFKRGLIHGWHPPLAGDD